MFQPSDLGKTIFDERYSHNRESWESACLRVARHVAQGEIYKNKWAEAFHGELIDNRFCPAGRIWYGAGRPKAQLLNCFVLPTSDSREGWGKTVSDVIVVSGTGGGIGINCSPIRPRGSDIRGTGGKASGAVSLMQLINKVGDVIVGGGNRRSALMLCLDVDHPDVEEFLNVKLDLGQLTLANISVVVNRPSMEFQEAVHTADDLAMGFAGSRSDRSLSADSLWERLVENAWKSGEPGVLNGWEANQKNNIWYHKPLISTNPCGEIWLEEYGCCCLGALVLPRFVSSGRMDWDALAHSIRLGVRFLDDVLSVNHFPLAEIKENCQNVRRIGLGVMGLHSMLLELGYKYSSQAGRSFIDTLFSFIKDTAYEASVDLAKEKGPFPAYDPRFLESGFTKTLSDGIRSQIEENGIRNCAMLTIAPTGTTGIVSGVSTGIEPLFAPVYWRNYRKIDDQSREHKAKELVVTPEFERFGELAEGAYDIAPEGHFEVQRIVQSHIDNAVSKTINLPSDYPVGQLAELWLDYLPYVKGTTLYRSGSRGNEPLEPVLAKDMNFAKLWGELDVQIHETDWSDQSLMDCPGGVCDINHKKEYTTAQGSYIK